MTLCLYQTAYLLACALIIWSVLLILAMTPKPQSRSDHLKTVAWMGLLGASLGGMASVLQNGFSPSLELVVFAISTAILVRMTRQKEEARRLKRKVTV